MTSKWAEKASTIETTVQKQEPIEENPQQDFTSKWKQISEEIKPSVEYKESSGAGGSFGESEWPDVLDEALINAPRSAYNYAKNIYQAVRHPVETVKTVGKLAVGLGEAFVGKETERAEQYRQLEDAMRERYGTTEGFKDAVANDPVGVLGDVASILIPAGKVAGLKTLTKAGTALEPTNIIIRSAALPFKLIPEKAAIDLYKSAVKFGTTLTYNQRKTISKTALKYQIMPTEKGLIKLRDLINQYNTEISDLINQSAKKGIELPTENVFKKLNKVKEQFKKTSDQPLQWDKAFKQLQKEWDEMLKVGEVKTPQEIQKIKTGIYRDLESFYEKHKATPAKVELRKGVATNCREMLENIIPEIKYLNRTDGDLLNLWTAIESKANRISNRDIISIGLPVKMGTGAGIGFLVAGESGGTIGSILGLSLGVFDTPQVKSKIALVLDKLRSKGVQVKPTRAAIQLGLYESGKATDHIAKSEPPE